MSQTEKRKHSQKVNTSADTIQNERQFSSSTNIKQICEIDRESCDRGIELGEIKSVLYYMKNGKSPGIDGLPCEFNKILGMTLDISLSCV